ncbi:hypothetical protein EG327_005328 [Venturia inaequalis]|uniref:Uncharacterized protein n=1 Tax=Venturia inaequalis TaxID=5025 RepID=A0A8H3V9U7_VENIN|nr:hypothetical protein EG327_005328 [Venturia inaequalis]
MSLKQTYNLAHTARCKLHLAADRPDRDLRFLVGHAMHLDSLMLRIIEIEENVEPPSNASGGLSFKGVAHASSSKSPLSDSKSRRSPPPPKSAEDESSDDDDDDDGGDDDGGIGKYEEEAEMGGGELSLSHAPIKLFRGKMKLNLFPRVGDDAGYTRKSLKTFLPNFKVAFKELNLQN